jgi:phospholipase C
LLTSHFRRLSDLPNDLASESPDVRPQVVFIEPDYHDSPLHFHEPCDNHPPLAMEPGEAFLGQVYRWLAATTNVWAESVLIVTYDEHGGFWDHVPPLPIVYRGPNGIAFDSTGPRVPTIVAGPFARQTVSHEQLDNTSILQLFAERFGAPGEAYSPQVQARAQQGIRSVSLLLDTAASNNDLAVVSRRPLQQSAAVTAHQGLRTGFSDALQSLVDRHGAEALAKYPELKSLLKV